MKPSIPLVALAALLLAACEKKSPPAASAGGEAAQPKRNMSESLGFVSADPGSYSAPEPAAPPPAASPPESVPAAPPTPPPAPAAPAPAGSIERTLTAKDGRTVEALLLSRTDTAVKIRRKADAAEFTIPLDRLSEADRSFILQSPLPTTPEQ